MQYFAAKVHMYLSMDFEIIFRIYGVTAINTVLCLFALPKLQL